MKIVWSNFALENIEIIATQIEKQSKQNAQKVIRDIVNRVAQLESFPNLGKIEEKLIDINLSHRFLAVDYYKIIYRIIENETIFITDVFSCKSNPKGILERAKKN